MLGDLKLAHKAVLLVLVPAVFELVFGCALFVLLRQAESNILREAHANTVIASANNLIKSFSDASTALFAYSATGSDLALERYQKLDQSINQRLLVLQLLVDADEQERKAYAPVRAAAETGLGLLDQSRDSVNRGISVSADAITPEVTDIIEGLASLTQRIHDFIIHEQGSAESVSEAQSNSRQIIFGLIVAGMVGGVALAVGLASLFHKGTTLRLNVLMDNIRRLARQQPLHPPLRGSDELHELDNVFHQMTDDLADANRSKKELMSMVTHDLRTPLMTVQMTLSMLNSDILGELPGAAKKQVSGAESSVQRLISLINDLLDIEKMEAGKLQINIDDVMVQDVFERTLVAIGEFAKYHEVTLLFEPSEIEFRADGDRLVQVLVNLVSNAIKFSSPKGTIRMWAVHNGKEVQIFVSDEGRGVPEELRTAIFERFKQVDQSDSHKGTGLGLAICKMIVDSHGGEIGVRVPELGKGSEFWFTVPQEAVVPMPDSQPA